MERFLNYLSGFNLVSEVLTRRRQKDQNQGNKMLEWNQRVDWCFLQVEGEAMNQETKVLLESEKSKETDGPFKPPEEMQACWHLDFGFLASNMVKECMCVVLWHQNLIISSISNSKPIELGRSYQFVEKQTILFLIYSKPCPCLILAYSSH